VESFATLSNLMMDGLDLLVNDGKEYLCPMVYDAWNTPGRRSISPR
jgi:hypothetical protein